MNPSFLPRLAIIPLLLTGIESKAQSSNRIEISARAALTNDAAQLRDGSGRPFSVAKSATTSPTNSFTFVSVEGRPDETGPPDTYGAVGLEHVLTILNLDVRVHSRGGSLLYSNSLLGFWNNTNSSRVLDPRAAFDPLAQRWIVISAANAQQASSRILIGVSKDSTPTNGWWTWDVKADTDSTLWADFPTLGFNKDWIVVQANMGLIAGGEPIHRSHIWVFNKTSLYAGTFQSPTLFVQTNTLTAGGEYPAVTYDESLSTVYLLQNVNGSNGCLRLYSITGSIGEETLNGVETPVYIRIGAS